MLSFVVLVVSVGFYTFYRFLSLDRQPRAIFDKFLADGSGVIAHRGENVDAPENTLSAFRLARRNGAMAVEIDVRFTKDGYAVLMHDETVDRTTNGSGNVHDFTLRDLCKLNAAHGHRLEKVFPDEKVPTLEEAIEECLRLNLKIIFDVKGNSLQAVPALITAYEKYDLYSKAIVASFDIFVLYKLRRAAPQILIGLTSRRWYFSHALDKTPLYSNLIVTWLLTCVDIIRVWSINAWLMDFLGSSLYVINRESISVEFVDYWNNRGIGIAAWTVNDPIEKSYYRDILKISFMTDSTGNTV
eukprot:m.4444 g.4444  ORF g.4444 m.4444 type:complete len:300 (+) comp10749_c0_seq2:214-1113(+)